MCPSSYPYNGFVATHALGPKCVHLSVCACEYSGK